MTSIWIWLIGLPRMFSVLASAPVSIYGQLLPVRYSFYPPTVFYFGVFFFVKFWRITSASSFGCPPSEDWFILILETNFLFKCHRFDDLEVTYFLLRNLMNPNHRMLSVSQPRSIFHMITKTFHYDCTQIYLFHLELTHLIEEMLRLLIMNSWCMDKKLFCADFRSRGCAI